MNEEPPRRGIGPLQVAKIMLSALFMIGSRKTWEGDGAGARMTPRQLALGVIALGAGLIAVLILLVRVVIGLAGG